MSRHPESITSPPERKSFLVATATFLSDYRTQFLTGVGTFLTVTSPLFPFPDWVVLVLVFTGAILLVFAIFYGVRDSATHSELEAERGRLESRELRARETLNTAIEHLAVELSREMKVYNHLVRLTVYAHDPINREFVPLARVSDNPEYKKLNRRAYPDNQGYLAAAWRNGEALGPNQTEYKAQKDALQSNFTEEEYAALPYKIACFLGRRLDNGTTPVGIIFWESTERGALDVFPLAESIKDNSTVGVLGSVLAASKELAPSLSELALKQSL